MSKSLAKKTRDKQVREGRRDPGEGRLNWNGVNPVTRRTPTLQEKQIRQMNKHKRRNLNRFDGTDSFFHAQTIRTELRCHALLNSFEAAASLPA